MEIEHIKITDLKPAEYNPRRISEEDYQKLKNSISTFGLVDPIIVNLKNMHIVGGHQRYDVLLDEHMLDNDFLAELPMIRLGDVGFVFTDTELSIRDDDHEKALNLALNKISGEWDLPKLELVLDDLESNNFDLNLTGFDLDDLSDIDDELDIDNLTPDPGYDVKEDDYEEPEDIETDIKYGDLFRLGDHYLLCGDATSEDDVTSLLAAGGERKVDLLFTDPPYNVNIGSIKHPKFKVRPIENDDMSTDDFKVFCRKWVNNIKSFVEGCCYICAGQGADGRIMFTICDELLHNSTTIIWNKDTFTLGRGKYQNKYEPIWFGWNESGKTFTDKRDLCNVFDINRPKKSELHPTMKPLELIITCLEHNPHAETVLDLFGGSGSTLISCEQTNRTCYMMELTPKYCQVIIDRWEEYTGKHAEKIKEFKGGVY